MKKILLIFASLLICGVVCSQQNLVGKSLTIRASKTSNNLATFRNDIIGDDSTVVILPSGKIQWSTDVNLYRSAANTLKTDDNLSVVGNIYTPDYVSAAGRFLLDSLGFYVGDKTELLWRLLMSRNTAGADVVYDMDYFGNITMPYSSTIQTTTGALNITSGDPGTSANSGTITMVADNSGTPQTGTIAVNYGANPYFRLSPPNSAGTATPVMDARSDLVSWFNGEAGVDYYFNFNGETNDGTITYMEDEDRFDFDNDVDVTGALTAGTIASDAGVSGTTVTGSTSVSIASQTITQTNPNKASFNNSLNITDTLFATYVNYALPNLLTNTDFLVNSQSTTAYYTDANTGFVNKSALSNCADSVTEVNGVANWSVLASATLSSQSAGGGAGGSAYYLQILENGEANPGANKLASLISGRLYRFAFSVKSGTEATYNAYVYDGVSTYGKDGNTESTGAWVTFTYYFVSKNTTGLGNLVIKQICSASAATTIFFDNVSLSEVSQAYIAANNKAPDGYTKDATLDIYTVDSPDSLVAGAIRGLRFKPSATSDWMTLYHGTPTLPSWIAKFKSRTVTLSLWVKTATASHCRISSWDGSTNTYSSYHTGGNTWELLSLTRTFGSSITGVGFTVWCDNAAGQVLITEPILNYGTSIPLYSPQSGLVILTSAIPFLEYNSVTISASVTGKDITTQTLGKIAPGAKAFHGQISGECATAEKSISVINGNTTGDGIGMFSQVANIQIRNSGIVGIDGDNTVDITRDDTWNLFKVLIKGIIY